jgi:hypothetical protein
MLREWVREWARGWVREWVREWVRKGGSACVLEHGQCKKERGGGYVIQRCS